MIQLYERVRYFNRSFGKASMAEMCLQVQRASGTLFTKCLKEITYRRLFGTVPVPLPVGALDELFALKRI